MDRILFYSLVDWVIVGVMVTMAISWVLIVKPRDYRLLAWVWGFLIVSIFGVPFTPLFFTVFLYQLARFVKDRRKRERYYSALVKRQYHEGSGLFNEPEF